MGEQRIVVAFAWSDIGMVRQRERFPTFEAVLVDHVRGNAVIPAIILRIASAVRELSRAMTRFSVSVWRVARVAMALVAVLPGTACHGQGPNTAVRVGGALLLGEGNAVLTGDVIEMMVVALDDQERVTGLAPDSFAWSSVDPQVIAVTGGTLRAVSVGQTQVSVTAYFSGTRYTVSRHFTVLSNDTLPDLIWVRQLQYGGGTNLWRWRSGGGNGPFGMIEQSASTANPVQSPGGAFIAAQYAPPGPTSSQVAILDGTTGEIVWTTESLPGNAVSPRWRSDSVLAFSADRNGGWDIWSRDMSSGTVTLDLTLQSHVPVLFDTQVGTEVIAFVERSSSEPATRLRLVDIGSGEARYIDAAPDGVRGAPRFSPNGELIAVATEGQIHVIRLVSGVVSTLLTESVVPGFASLETNRWSTTVQVGGWTHDNVWV